MTRPAGKTGAKAASKSNRQKQDADAAFAPDGSSAAGPSAKLYEFTDNPANILQALGRFEELAPRFLPRKRLMFWGLLALTLALAYALLSNTLEYNGWLVGLAWAYMLFSLSLKAIVDWKRGTAVKGFPGWALIGMFIGGFTLFAQFGDGTSTGGVAQYVALLQGQRSDGRQMPVGISIIFALGVVLIPYAWATYFRFRRVIPQPAEIYFCSTILRGLLKEVAPGARCRVAFNPFPAEWSGYEGKTPAGKTAYYDSLLMARLGLGSGRALSLAVMHRRSSKGRRKHKGWKHKVKVKYCLSDEAGFDIFKKDADARAVSQSIVQATRDLQNLESDWKFRTSVGTASSSPVTMEKNAVIVTQGYFNECAMWADLSPKDLPHPELVLATIRGLSQGVYRLSGAPKDPAQA